MFMEKGFVQTHTPILTSSDCEGAGEVFSVGTTHTAPTRHGDGDGNSNSDSDDGSFFKAPKYLTVSSQLHLEALAQSLGKVWTLSPTFRAEKSDTARHLSEFYMLEAEISFTENMRDVMDVVQATVQAITAHLGPGMSRLSDELGTINQTDFERRIRGAGADWPCITYTEAIKLLQASTHQFTHEPRWGAGLQAEHERYLATAVGETRDQQRPVFVTHYPKAIKPFYMLPSAPTDEGRETVDCFDLLVPDACEIVGGSMREYRLEPLLDAMRAHHLIPPGPNPSDEDLGSLKWYVDLRRWGSVPHGGFGLGFDRLLSYLAGVPNIREVVTFPRWVGRCDC
jgi:asparaginyl-tRNA synthetase